MDWNRINIWTNTLYILIHSLSLSKQIRFGNLTYLEDSIRDAGSWIGIDCSYTSVLLDHPFGGRKVTFRRDPNKHFSDISAQIIKILIQDLVVILDEMMSEILISYNEHAGLFPQSKIEKLASHLDEKYIWAARGCLELVAARNVLTHGGGRWNDRTIPIVESFVLPPPKNGEKLSVGFSMLFRYRKAMRTFLNEANKDH